MTNEHPNNTSQDYDRKHGKNHVAETPRAAKRLVSKSGDKRELAREEYTNHFTNRAPGGSK